jgi:hypothetical protein
MAVTRYRTVMMAKARFKETTNFTGSCMPASMEGMTAAPPKDSTIAEKADGSRARSTHLWSGLCHSKASSS